MSNEEMNLMILGLIPKEEIVRTNEEGYLEYFVEYRQWGYKFMGVSGFTVHNKVSYEWAILNAKEKAHDNLKTYLSKRYRKEDNNG